MTILGSISGVRPTATAMAKKKASDQFPLVNPLMKNTSGTMTRTNRRISHVNFAMPLSKALSSGCSDNLSAMPPRYVSLPVATTTSVAQPLSTLAGCRFNLHSAYGVVLLLGVMCFHYAHQARGSARTKANVAEIGQRKLLANTAGRETSNTSDANQPRRENSG